MDNKNHIESLPITATTLSIIARFIFMYLLYKNKSSNTYSLIFCILSIISSSIWLFYSIWIDNISLIYRSGTEIGLLAISAIYIIRNKMISETNNGFVQEMNRIVAVFKRSHDSSISNTNNSIIV